MVFRACEAVSVCWLCPPSISFLLSINPPDFPWAISHPCFVLSPCSQRRPWLHCLCRGHVTSAWLVRVTRIRCGGMELWNCCRELFPICGFLKLELLVTLFATTQEDPFWEWSQHRGDQSRLMAEREWGWGGTCTQTPTLHPPWVAPDPQPPKPATPVSLSQKVS